MLKSKPVKLQLKTGAVAVEVDPDASKVRNHDPIRFRISHGVSVNVGVDTFFLSRKQVEELKLEMLTDVLQSKQAESEAIIQAANSRIQDGQVKMVRALREVGRLTHPDILTILDMRRDPNQYVNASSPFFKMFQALARKVMDLSFYNCGNGVSQESRKHDFIAITGAVTRGLDQFVYATPNKATASPYVNFSVIPLSANYEDVRFPKYYDGATGETKKIPKSDFIQHYAFAVNELFNCYRRYLRMLSVSTLEADVDAGLNVDSFVTDPDESKPYAPGLAAGESIEEGSPAGVVIEGLKAEQEASNEREVAARERQKAAKDEAEHQKAEKRRAKAAAKQAERAKERQIKAEAKAAAKAEEREAKRQIKEELRVAKQQAKEAARPAKEAKIIRLATEIASAKRREQEAAKEAKEAGEAFKPQKTPKKGKLDKPPLPTPNE